MDTAKEKKTNTKGEDKKPSVLVAGGAGFLGSYLCEALAAQNLNVICIDNLAHGSKGNIERLLSLPNFTFWEEDINKPGFTVSPTIGLTHVFHLAGVEEFLSASEVSLQTLIVNSFGTKNLLDLAVSKKAKFILVSSTEVFQGVLTQTNLSKYFSESDLAQITFAEAKRFAEALTAEYLKKYNLDAIVVRIKDPYGPRMSLSAGNTLANLISQAAKGKRIEILGDGFKTINPTFVTDIIYGIVKAAFQGGRGDVFNLINQEKTTERSVAETLQKTTGVEVVYKEKSEIEAPQHPLIFSKTLEKLNWTTKVPLDQGLSQTVTFYNEKPRGKETSESIPTPIIPELAKGKRGPNKRLLSIIIGAAVSILIFWTVILPAANFYSGFYFGNKNLEAAVAALSQDRANVAIEKAKKAQNHYHNSLNAVGNISWLPKLVGQKEKTRQIQNYLFIAEGLSKTAKYSGQALAALDEAVVVGKNLDQILEQTETAKENIDSAKNSLVIAKSVETKTPSFIDQSLKKRKSEVKILDELVETIELDLETIP